MKSRLRDKFCHFLSCSINDKKITIRFPVVDPFGTLTDLGNNSVDYFSLVT